MMIDSDNEFVTLADVNIFAGDQIIVRDSEIHENRDIAGKLFAGGNLVFHSINVNKRLTQGTWKIVFFIFWSESLSCIIMLIFLQMSFAMIRRICNIPKKGSVERYLQQMFHPRLFKNRTFTSWYISVTSFCCCIYQEKLDEAVHVPGAFQLSTAILSFKAWVKANFGMY